MNSIFLHTIWRKYLDKFILGWEYTCSCINTKLFCCSGAYQGCLAHSTALHLPWGRGWSLRCGRQRLASPDETLHRETRHSWGIPQGGHCQGASQQGLQRKHEETKVSQGLCSNGRIHSIWIIRVFPKNKYLKNGISEKQLLKQKLKNIFLPFFLCLSGKIGLFIVSLKEI